MYIVWTRIMEVIVNWVTSKTRNGELERDENLLTLKRILVF